MTGKKSSKNRSPTKVTYQSKADAVAKLRYLQNNSNSKNLPVRVYEDETGWHLTKLNIVDEIPLLDLITAALKYSEGKRYGKDGVYKRQWEEEKKLRAAISKTILNFK
ncbi:MAG: hypothetical protein WAZ19_02240 [Anaerolineae bacterium]